MAPQNSQIDFYVGLLSEMLTDIPPHIRSAGSIRNMIRDRITIQSRVLNEGLGFLTKTLPKLGKALDRGLTDMRFVIPNGFQPAKNKSTPAFLQEYFKRIFDHDGCLLADADPVSVAYVRQICFSLYKLELPYKVADQRRVIDAFVAVEEELSLSDELFATEEILGAAYLIRDALDDFDHQSISPRHGPGAVATGERLDEKWVFSRHYRGIHEVYPYHDYFTVGGDREAIDRLDWLDSMQQLETGCAKVVLVPKDSRGPRLISAEPLEYQWIQQGLGRGLMAHVESSRMTRGRVNFTNQEVNRQLALQSSLTGEFATLDLKDASDRVSLRLVRSLFRFVPDLLRALEATRTTETRLPDGRVVPLKKFAPMGSALCFPVEALCFWVLCVSAISRWARLRPSEVWKDVYVYGDDIIVKTEYVDVCIQVLERYGLKVNRDKSCISGGFRESCGMDAFRGVVVTPTRAKTLWSGKFTDGNGYVSWVSFANQMAEKGFANTAHFVWKRLERTYRRAVPYGTVFASYPCKVVPDALLAEQLNMLRFARRWNADLQHYEYLVKTTKTRVVDCKVEGWSRLLRGVTTSFIDRDPTVNVVPRSLKIKLGWVATH